jgi:glycosyltransferase involved in cell wall biosynthesis
MFGIESVLFRQSAAIHSISRDIARTVESQYGVKLREETTSIIPLGLSPRQAVPADLPGELRLLFVGRLERRKGIDVLLAIAPRLLERHPKLVLCLVGDDTLGDGEGSTFRRRFEAAFKDHPAAGRVHFEGKATDERLYSCFAGCDIFVAPSRYESFGLIFLEAMMFGKPVVGCRAGGMPEIIADGETGLLAEPGDEESLLRCLDRLAADADLRERLGRRGREVYEAKFTAQAAAAATEAFLRKFSRAGKERP